MKKNSKNRRAVVGKNRPVFNVSTRNKRRNINNNRRITKTSNLRKMYEAPASIQDLIETEKPIINSLDADRTVVKHYEFIKDLYAVGTFTPEQFFINPGVSDTFPWLSSVAQRFEKYHFKKLAFHYRSRSATDVGGAAMMMIDYDATDDIPIDKVTMLASQSLDAAPWMTFRFDMSEKMMHDFAEYLFVRSAAEYDSALSQLNSYDAGFLIFANEIPTSTEPVGELWVEYEVVLKVPQFNTLISMGYEAFAETPTSNSQPLTGDYLVSFNDKIDIDIDNSTSGTHSRFSISKLGTYLLEVVCTGDMDFNPADVVVAGYGNNTVTKLEESFDTNNLYQTWVLENIVRAAIPLLTAYFAVAASSYSGTLSLTNFKLAPYSKAALIPARLRFEEKNRSKIIKRNSKSVSLRI